MPALEEIIYSGYVATGQPVFDFEDQFKKYIGNDNIISVHSGTDALHLAYILAGVKPGDEIISTPMTAEPTNTSIAMVGAKVVWGDVDPKNGLLDPNSVRKLITERPKRLCLFIMQEWSVIWTRSIRYLRSSISQWLKTVLTQWVPNITAGWWVIIQITPSILFRPLST